MSRLILFHRLILRPLLAQPSRALLTLVAVALGVAVVIAIDLAGFAAAGSFRSSMESLSGKAQWEIVGTGGIPEATLGKLATLPENASFEPRMEEFVTDEASGATATLIGLDLVANPRRSTVTKDSGSIDQLDDLRAAYVTPAFGRKVGDLLPVIVQDRQETLKVAGIFQLDSDTSSQDRLIVVDIPVAQELTGRVGRLDRIEVSVPSFSQASDAGAALAEQELLRVIEGELPAGTQVRPFGARTDANRRMLEAFRWNLRVLSGVALVVGAFLIYNTISVSVVRRRGEIGVLRALGVTRAGAQAIFLLEAATFGAIGGFIGSWLGYGMAHVAVQLLAATVSSLYVTSSPGEVLLSSGYLLVGVLLGCAVATVAALAPAREAGSIAPVEAMARGGRDYAVRVHTGRSAIWACLLLIVGAGLCYLPPIQGTPVFGYVATLLLILGTALLAPAVLTLAHRLTEKRVQHVLGVEALLAARNIFGSLRRSTVLVAALATAVAMMASVGIMVGSFRQTVLVWMDNQIQADLYIRAAAPAEPGVNPPIDPEVAARIRTLPMVAEIDRLRTYPLMLHGKPTTFSYADAAVMERRGRVSFLPGQNRESILEQMARGAYVVVSEPFSQKHGVSVGSRMELPLPDGDFPVTVIGVFNDYASERGTIYGDERVFAKHFTRENITGIAVYLKDGVDIEEGRLAVQQATANRRVMISTNRSLRESAIRIFDQTFAITWALEGVAIFVAVLGMAGALLAMVMDRRRELSMLRFLGASQRQIQGLLYWEAALLGMLSNLLGLALGLALSLVLIYVINRQSFGWTFQFHWPGSLLLAAISLIYVCTLAAAWFPARAATRLNPIEVIHEE